ncbi:unnamed protein product, partial [Pleuronectes platessa]
VWFVLFRHLHFLFTPVSDSLLCTSSCLLHRTVNNELTQSSESNRSGSGCKLSQQQLANALSRSTTDFICVSDKITHSCLNSTPALLLSPCRGVGVNGREGGKGGASIVFL